MIIQFSVENFRSIKNKETLSLIADSGKTNSNNVFEALESIKMLKSAVIYGANASGKTNVIRAFHAFHQMILRSTDYKNGESIRYYNPFRLDIEYRNRPTKFSLDFVYSNIRFTYFYAFNEKEIISERLDFYPKNYRANLFIREKGKSVKLGKSFLNKRIDKKVLNNHLFLTKSGNSGHKQMGELYLYFRKIAVWNSHSQNQIKQIRQNIEALITSTKGKDFNQKLNKLIKIADTKIEAILVHKLKAAAFVFPDQVPNSVKDKVLKENKFRTYAMHRIYKNGEESGFENFDINEESEGTRMLFVLGGLLLKQLEIGGIVFIDEIENSMHPRLCKFLIKLFHNQATNTKNSQLIFATHETTLLDKENFRKDQIWFTEKNKFGETELYSAADFEGVRNDIPFEEWYMNGKFGGQPNIKEIEFMYDNHNDDGYDK